MIWNNGDGSDLQEGGPGNDISIFNGNVAATDVMNALAGTVAGRVLFSAPPPTSTWTSARPRRCR